MIKFTRSHGFLIILLLVSTILVTHNINQGEFWYQDDARHTMNGLFYLDLFTDHPSNPVQYTMEYFARYPALSIVIYPPLFYLVEALLFGILGFSMVTAKFTVLLFYLLFAASLFYLFKQWSSELVAFYATLLTIATPFIVFWGRTVMLEIPHLAFFIIAIYFFTTYLETEKPQRLYLTALFSGLAIITKVLALPLVLLFILYAIFHKRDLFTKKESWISVGIFTIITAPWFFVLLTYGRWTLGNAVSYGMGGVSSFVGNLLLYPRILFTENLTIPLVGLAVLGFVFLAYRIWHDRGSSKVEFRILAWWIFSVYVFFTILVHKHTRYPILYLPAFIFLGVMAIHDIAKRWKKPWLFHALLLMLILITLYSGYTVSYPYKDGYFAAGEAVAENYPGVVLFVGDNNGNFIYGVRKHATNPNDFVILRADLVLTSFAIFSQWDTTNYVTEPSDFYNQLSQYGVNYVIYEEGNGLQQELKSQGINSYEIAEEAVSDSTRFLKLEEFPVQISSDARTLVLYQYLNAPKTDQYTFYVPTLGRNVTLTTN